MFRVVEGARDYELLEQAYLEVVAAQEAMMCKGFGQDCLASLEM
jgi:hypothetical protein